MKNIFKKVVVLIIQWEAKLVLKKYKPTIVAVTGSVGKTSTKDAIYTVLASFKHVRKSDKSFNSEIGVPLTILGCQNGWNNPIKWLDNIYKGFSLIISKTNYPEILVLEVGADRPGDIKAITQWLKPHVAVVTRFASVPVHIEYFKSRDQLIREKRYLVEALRRDSVAVLNYDDEEVRVFGNYTDNKKMMFGFNGGEVQASHYYIADKGTLPKGVAFDVVYDNQSMKVEIDGGLGKQQVYPVLAAITVGLSQGLPLAGIVEAIKKHVPPKGRMHLIDGIKNSTIIDDTYNASPVAVEEALETLRNLPKANRKIAVLGDMLELGVYSADAHRDIGIKASKSADIIVTVGIRARKIAETALDQSFDEKNIFQFDDSKEAGAFLQNMIQEGDVILVKGSQSIRTERTVKEIMAHPEDAPSLLVRQEEEWLAKK